MSESYGNGVSRTLSALERQFLTVVVQRDTPPLDSQDNLFQQLSSEALRQVVKSQVPSGFLLDPTRALDDFQTDESWSNYFILGNPQTGEEAPIMLAYVNGWFIPVAGTQTNAATDVTNVVRLYPPPESDSRIDFVFLEVWQTLVSPNPATANKPSADKIWKYGNVEYGGTNIDDDLEDPNIGYETSKRVQLQYRIRVFGQGQGLGTSVALDVYPDGLDDPNIYGQGTASSPVSGYTFTNMRELLKDPGLWRAGDGNPENNLGTVDGYSYAIPICAIFRRNSTAFVAVTSAGNPNQNGSKDRNPSANYLSNPREGAKTLSTPTLISAIDPTTVGVVQVSGLVNSGFDDPYIGLANTFMVIDDEIIGISAVNVASSPATITIPTDGRGRGMSTASRHEAASEIRFFSARPDGLFADQIADTDIFELRRGVNFGDWDYSRLLIHNLTSLIQGTMRSTWKQSGAGDTEGVYVIEVDYLHANGSLPVPNHTEALDGPDGIRTAFSDAAVIQPEVTVLCDNDATLSSGYTADQFDSNVQWTIGADFKPNGFMNNLGATGSFTNGTCIFLNIGGDSGSQGARATFRDGTTRAVRFVSPREFWKDTSSDPNLGRQHPVVLRWLNEQAHMPVAPGELGVDPNADKKHPGGYYPLSSLSFEKPFIVLGGLLHSSLVVSGLSSDPAPATPGLVAGPNGPEIRLGLDFDTVGNFYSLDSFGNFESDPTQVSVPLLRGERTLYDMITDYGRDGTGASSEVYIVLYGDTSFTDNNGAFKVIGAGTVGYTNKSAQDAYSVRVEPLSQGVVTFTIAPGQTLTAQFRSQITNAEDGSGFASGPARSSLAIVLTDIQGVEGGEGNPWNATNLGANAIPAAVASKLLIDTTLLYHPGRGGMARVPGEIDRISVVSAGSEYLRQAVSTVDTNFPGESGLPPNETFFDYTHVQLWNRLPSRGLTETTQPKAPNFGGNVVAFSEQDRESECFFDLGSKTILFRPMKDQSLTVNAVTTSCDPSLIGSLTYPGGTPKDGAAIFTANKTMGFALSSEFMPRFGRHDIPYREDTSGGVGAFLEGINHLFVDSTDPTEPVFYLVGGQDNTSGGNLVTSMYFQTGSTSGHDYGDYGTIVGPGTPAYQARLTTDIGSLTIAARDITSRLQAVVSSDLGAGLKGIQLPPYLGVARVYGVYDRADFVAKGGLTYQSDRVTPEADPATNLLKRGGTQQTLFIFQDGAKDLTLTDGDHTYIIPSNEIDLSLSPYYSPGVKEEFDDFEFVVECVVFGFAQGWINENNYLLCRKHTGTGATIVDGDDPELEGVHLVIPSPATLNDEMYICQSRTPYQGDPYMTRAGETRTVSDYEFRYGQVANSESVYLTNPIQQLDSSGNQIVEVPNARALQVLASVDFFTTFGTGKIGGEMYPGTLLDSGYTQDTSEASTRIPSSSTQPAWRVLTRALTEGQRENTSHATVSLEIRASGASMVGAEVTIFPVASTPVTFTGVLGAPATDNEFDVTAPVEVVAQSLTDQINNHPLLYNQVVGAAQVEDRVLITAVPVGSVGNQIRVGVSSLPTDDAIRVITATRGDEPFFSNVSSAFLTGGVDLPVNGGDGFSQIYLTGMTDRLPLGILLQDSDFIAENPLGDAASAFRVIPGIRPVQNVLPLTVGGAEYTRFFGDPGQLLSLSDGGILQYVPYNSTTAPTGTKRFRIYRGGGATFVLSGRNPGGPIDWLSTSFPGSNSPVMKGGVLACKALLVRNFQEKAFSTDNTVSHGDEIQMVVLTYGVLGDGATRDEGVLMSGINSPTGYGDGYSGVDRYRLEGKPMTAGYSRTAPDPNSVRMAIFPGRDE